MELPEEMRTLYLELVFSSCRHGLEKQEAIDVFKLILQECLDELIEAKGIILEPPVDDLRR